jgi:replicative DNA helicase
MSVGLKLLRSIVDNQATQTFHSLNEEWFQAENDELLSYRFVKEHLTDHGCLPTLGTCEEGGIALDLADEPSSYYVERINDRYLYNVIRPKFLEIHRFLQSNDITNAKEHIKELYMATREADNSNALSGFGESAQDLKRKYIDRQFRVGFTGISFGWNTVDNYTDGMLNQDLIALVGRMGVGKTYLLCFIVIQALLQNKSVLFVTLEMSKEQLKLRLASILAQIPINAIKFGTLDMHSRAKYFRTIDDLADMNLITFMEAGLHRSRNQRQVFTEDIENAIEECDPDLVVTDGAYLLHVDKSSKYKARWERISEVSDDMKRIAIKRDRPIIMSVQFNREQSSSSRGRMSGNEKDLDLGNISGSDNIAMVCSHVLGIKKSSEGNKLEIHGLKNREGESNYKVRIHNDFDRMDFGEDCDITHGEEDEDTEITVSLEDQI